MYCGPRDKERNGAAEDGKPNRRDGASARSFLSIAKIFILRNPARAPIVESDKRAGESVRERPQCWFFGMQSYLEFTLPMLVIRNYVLEPE
jgi:hypothetical protein